MSVVAGGYAISWSTCCARAPICCAFSSCRCYGRNLSARSYGTAAQAEPEAGSHPISPTPSWTTASTCSGDWRRSTRCLSSFSRRRDARRPALVADRCGLRAIHAAIRADWQFLRAVTIFQGIPLPTASQGLDLAAVSLWSPSCFLNPTPGTEFLFGRPAFPLVASLRLDQGSSVPGSNSARGQTIALRVSICPSCRARPIYPPERDRASSGIREAIAWLTVSQLSRLQPCGPGASPGGRCCATIPMPAKRACASRLSRASASTRSTRWPLPSGACAPVLIRFPRTCSLRRSLNGLTHEGSQDVGPITEAGRAGPCRRAGGNAWKRCCVGCVALAGRAHLPEVATQPGPAGLSGSATELAEL